MKVRHYLPYIVLGILLFAGLSSAMIDLTGTQSGGGGSSFSGSWDDLTDIPAGFSDNIDNETSQIYINTFTISPSGDANYTSIQSALDANPVAGSLFIVYPGTYVDTINFTADRQVVQSAGHVQNVIVTQVDNSIVNVSDYESCLIKYLNIRLTAPTTAINAINIGDGFLGAISCKLYLSCTANIAGADQPHIVNVYGSGLYKQKYGEFEYYHSGNTGAGIKAPYDITGTGEMQILRACQTNITNSGTALATTIFVEDGTGDFEIVDLCEGVVRDKDADIVTAMGYLGGGASNEEISFCHVHVYAGNTGNAYAIYHTGSGEVRSTHNKFHIYSSGADRHSFFIGAGDTLISQFDDIIAPDGLAGTGTLVAVSSESDGSITLTDALHLKYDYGVDECDIYVDGDGDLHIEPTGIKTVIGDGNADIDYELYFYGETNQGSIIYSEDEDQFNITSDVDVDGSVTADKFIGQSYMYPVWAEENAGLGTNEYEWAFGNGANTPSDGGLTMYVPSGWNCSIVAMSIRVGGGTANVSLVKNGVVQGENAYVNLAAGQSAITEFQPLYVSNNDYINFRTTSSAGTSGPCVVTAWVYMERVS